MTPYETGIKAAQEARASLPGSPPMSHRQLDAALRAAIEAAKRETEEEMVNKKARGLGAGATGQYPEGSISPDDEGELKTILMVKGDRLFLLFGKPVSWLSFTKSEAVAWANGLLEKAKKLP